MFKSDKIFEKTRGIHTKKYGRKPALPRNTPIQISAWFLHSVMRAINYSDSNGYAGSDYKIRRFSKYTNGIQNSTIAKTAHVCNPSFYQILHKINNRNYSKKIQFQLNSFIIIKRDATTVQSINTLNLPEKLITCNKSKTKPTHLTLLTWIIIIMNCFPLHKSIEKLFELFPLIAFYRRM